METPSKSNTQRLLTAVVALQVVTLLTSWTGNSTIKPAVAADIPDPGSRQMQMIDELKQLNSKLGRLTDFVESGRVKVVVSESDQKK